MKCVCGYEVNQCDRNISDGEKFKRTLGHFAIVSGYPRYGGRKIHLYGCPKCGTIKFEE